MKSKSSLKKSNFPLNHISTNSSNPTKIENSNSNGLGNSFFKGQKFIDFQEPINESIQPITSGIRIHDIHDNEYNNETDIPQLMEIKDLCDHNENITIAEEMEDNNCNKRHRKIIFDSEHETCQWKRAEETVYEKSKYFNILKAQSKTQPAHLKKLFVNSSNEPNSAVIEPTNYYNHGIQEYQNPNEGQPKNENLEFLSTLMRLKSGQKADNSHYTNNWNQNNKTDDDSKSYIKELLELCSDGEYFNRNEFENLDNRSFSIHSSDVNDIGGFTNGEYNEKPVIQSSNNQESSTNPQSYTKNNRKSPKGLKTQELIEITNRRKKMIENLTSVDAYLRRRHLEALSKVEKLRKQKEHKETGNCNFTPQINKHSREIAERIISEKIADNALIKVRKVDESEEVIRGNRIHPQITEESSNNSPHDIINLNSDNNKKHSINHNVLNQIDQVLKDSNIDTNSSHMIEQNKEMFQSGHLQQQIDGIHLKINNKIFLPDGDKRQACNIESENSKKYLGATSGDMINKGLKAHNMNPSFSNRLSYEVNPIRESITNNQPSLVIQASSCSVPKEKMQGNENNNKKTKEEVCHADGDFPNMKTLTKTKENENENSLNSVNMVQLFPVNDKTDFQLETNIQKTIICSNEEQSSNIQLDNFSGYQPHHHPNIEYISGEESEVRDYNPEKNRQQNESRNLKEIKLPTNAVFPSTQNLNENNTGHNVSSTLNLSKFTNFVGLSQIPSKKTINYIPQQNYYSNILSKPPSGLKNLPEKNNNETISQRNMISCFDEAQSQSKVIIPKTQSTKTLEKMPMVNIESNSKMINSGIISDDTVQEDDNANANFCIEEPLKGAATAEINLFDDEIHYTPANVSKGDNRFMKLNYFEENNKNLLASLDKEKEKILVDNQESKIYTDINKITHTLPNIEAIKENKIEYDIDEIINPKYLFKNLNSKMKKKLSKSFCKQFVNENKQVDGTRAETEACININTNTNAKINSNRHTRSVSSSFIDKNPNEILEPKAKSKFDSLLRENLNADCLQSNVYVKRKPDKRRTALTKKPQISLKEKGKQTKKTENRKNLLKEEPQKIYDFQLNKKDIDAQSDQVSNSGVKNIISEIEQEKILVDHNTSTQAKENQSQIQIPSIKQSKTVRSKEKETKTPSSPITYDLSKFSIDIPQEKGKSKPDTFLSQFSYMNEIVSNTIRLHRENQENSRRQISNLLNKIQKSQDFSEENLRQDINDLNMSENSLLKMNDSNAVQLEYEIELENVNRNHIIF